MRRFESLREIDRGLNTNDFLHLDNRPEKIRLLLPRHFTQLNRSTDFPDVTFERCWIYCPDCE